MYYLVERRYKPWLKRYFYYLEFFDWFGSLVLQFLIWISPIIKAASSENHWIIYCAVLGNLVFPQKQQFSGTPQRIGQSAIEAEGSQRLKSKNTLLHIKHIIK